jgi:hypothetical protein
MQPPPCAPRQLLAAQRMRGLLLGGADTSAPGYGTAVSWYAEPSVPIRAPVATERARVSTYGFVAAIGDTTYMHSTAPS